MGLRGVWRGRVTIADDFDDLDTLPDEFREAFGL